ncbi:uncharacterized protein FIBRA_01475 [Fibroporia radiculosa]|uniref:Uncharacterized protein n=1 Tax=Fibroporia radiculosa TaxID=599839 RepID=J4HTE6_9APHY|nr:uncharacterized protein FIBRA_01475 [Fibroporia radiculosa]CCL99457.1 predicted protein [Fibroporia radiculosa]
MADPNAYGVLPHLKACPASASGSSEFVWLDASALAAASGLDDFEQSAEFLSPAALQKWQQRHAKKAQQAHLRRLRYPRPSMFSPHAAPFVPAALRRLEPQRYGKASSGSDSPLQVCHPWMTAMRRGAVGQTAPVRKAQAEVVVSLGPWDTRELSDLAGKLSDRAGEGYGPDLGAVSLFCRELHDRFESHQGPACAAQFVTQLKECVMNEFWAWWHWDSPTSVVHLSEENESRALCFLSSATAIAVFVADLFAQDLLPAKCLHICLDLLVARMTVIEQLYAVHNMVSHASVRIYDGQTMVHFAEHLCTHAIAIQSNSSIVHQKFNRDHVSECTREVCDIVKGWIGVGPSSLLSPAPVNPHLVVSPSFPSCTYAQPSPFKGGRSSG